MIGCLEQHVAAIFEGREMSLPAEAHQTALGTPAVHLPGL